MIKLLVALSVPFACLGGGLATVSAHDNHNNSQNCINSDIKIDENEGCVYVCHQNEGGHWVVLKEDQHNIGGSDFKYEGPLHNGHPNKDAKQWCEDNQTPTPVPEPTPTPTPTPPTPPPTPPTPAPSVPVDTSELPPLK